MTARGAGYFGEPWRAGVCENRPRHDTPVGEICLLCHEAIRDGDRGTFLLQPNETYHPVHRECMVREVVGGIGHLTDHALWCHGLDDPDGGMSRRESSLAVWRFIAERVAGRVQEA